MENLQYSTKQNVKRTIIPELLKLSIFSIAIYFLLVLNFKLAKYSMTAFTKTIVISLLVFLTIAGIIFMQRKALNTIYYFYSEFVDISSDGDEKIPYAQIQNIEVSEDFFDKLLGTGTIIINNDKKIEHIKNHEQILNYLNQMISYSRKTIGGSQAMSTLQQPQQNPARPSYQPPQSFQQTPNINRPNSQQESQTDHSYQNRGMHYGGYGG